MLRFSDSVLFTTELMPPSRPRPGNWWYYAVEHGQHVSIYSQRTLEKVAEHFGLHLLTDGVRLHLLTKRRLGGRKFRFVTRPRVAAWIDLLRQRPTLLTGDFEAALAEAARGGGAPPPE